MYLEEIVKFKINLVKDTKMEGKSKSSTQYWHLRSCDKVLCKFVKLFIKQNILIFSISLLTKLAF